MAYRLGLDVGTASVGAAAVLLDEHEKDIRFAEWNAVRLFDEPTVPEKGKPKSKKAVRREARIQRRQVERRAGRLRDVARLAPLLGLDAAEIPRDSGQNLPRLRAQSARERVELADLLLIFLRLAKRRGYYGAFRNTAAKASKGRGKRSSFEEEEDGASSATDDAAQASAREVQGGSQALALVMAHRAAALDRESLILGEYLYDRIQRGLPSRLKIQEVADNKKSKRGKEIGDPERERSNLYALNDLVKAEFEQIWRTQAAVHPLLNGSDEYGTPIKDHFYDAIFFKRPLRSPAAMVGKCMLEPNLPRAPRAQMAYQAFRIEKVLGDIAWGIGKHAPRLAAAQKAVIRDLLAAQKEVAFSEIENKLVDAGCPKPPGKSLNLQQEGREALIGNTTLAAFRKLGLESEWLGLDDLTQTQVINFLADLGSPEQLMDDDWHKNILRAKANKAQAGAGQGNGARTFSPMMIAFIDQLRANPKFDRLFKMGFDGGRASYSLKALTKLTDWLREPHWSGDTPPDKCRVDEEAAIAEERRKRQRAAPSLRRELQPHPATGNDVVDVALREVLRVVNDAIRHLGAPPAEIIVELGRDMTVGLSKRGEIIDAINRQQKRRKTARDKIEARGHDATPTAIDRYLLAEEQGYKCPYCQDHNHMGLADVLSGAATHFEHILPRSLTQVRRKKSELLLAHRACNDAKGDQTPFLAWGEGRDPKRWIAVEAMAAYLSARARGEKDRGVRRSLERKARLLLLRDYECEVLTDESIADFAERQMHQTSWIAKLVAEWLKSICANVFVARGELTSYLRNVWGLNTVIPELRYEAGLPVLDTDNKPMSKEDFDRFRPIWEGRPRETAERTSRMIEKRIDHRHHLIDACVIALSTRGLFQEMARHYKEMSERATEGARVQLWLRPQPPFDSLRAQALHLARTAGLSHKPDRFPEGAFFQATAYRKVSMDDGNSRIAVRAKLIELTDSAGSLDKARKGIGDIVSADTRRIVSEEFERRIAAGRSVKEALSIPIICPRYGTEISKVSVYQRTGRGFVDGANANRVVHASRYGEHEKHYLSGGYAFVSLHTSEGRVVSAASVTLLAAARQRRAVMKEEIRFHAGDALTDRLEGRTYVVRQIKANATLVLTPITEAREVRGMDAASGLLLVSGKSLLRFDRL